MEKSPKLKDVLLANVPKTVVLHKRLQKYPATDFRTKQPKMKDDGTQEYNYMYVFMEGSNEYVHYANEIEEETLSSYQEGQELVVQKIEKKRTGKPSYFIVQWSENGSAESRVHAEPTPTVQRQVVQHAEKHTEVVTSQILHGFFTAAISSGKAPEEAYKIALKAYGLHQLAVEFTLLNKESIMKRAKELLPNQQ